MSEARDSRYIADNRQQVERLNRLGWYHSLELPDGSVIAGHQTIKQLRARLHKFHIPEDLTGKRVLDIGAWDGWFSFEMERRGAQVLAVDSAKNTRLLEAKKLLGSRIDYRIADICRLTSREVGTFDIVLFLGVLYHLKHPLLALENVCGMCTDMACIESFVTDPDPGGIPMMEYYETAELRGQLDNWCGPNTACLLAFTRTAGFARVDFEGVLGERAHVTGYRKWLAAEGDGAGDEAPPQIRSIENSNTHDHEFSACADDYLTLYFTSPRTDLNCDNVYPEIGGYGSRPLHVTPGQVTCKLPPGLNAGWHNVRLRAAGTRWTPSYRIAVGLPREQRIRSGDAAGVKPARVADGKVFENGRIRVGEDSVVSVWTSSDSNDLRLRLNGTDLPPIWISGPDTSGLRQINALLPAGLEPGTAVVTVATSEEESQPVNVELYK